MIRQPSLSNEHFEAIYAREADPWRFRTSGYEQQKYAATIAALPKARYRSGFEAACSVGVLTRMLAERCDRLLATDAAAAPLETARAASADTPHVTFRQGRIPEDWPEGSFDLIVLSEVLYYLSAEDVCRVAARAVAALEPGGHVVLVHWLPAAEPPFPLSGDEATGLFIAAAGPAFSAVTARRTEQYRLDVLQRIEAG